MAKVCVIIPFFQREPGILRRTLASVSGQRLPPGLDVDVIVVDDGSPVPAAAEADGIAFPPPLRLTIITQPNGGVAAARNTGLTHVHEATDYIAFLDSDDAWHEEHLARGVGALERGNDFYFCDNRREGHHDSYFAASPLLVEYLEGSPQPAAHATHVEIARDKLLTLVLREFVAQLSTVIYRSGIASGLTFDTTFRKSGEDILFLMRLISKAERLCFSPTMVVGCGRGINLYFDNLGWDTPDHLAQVISNLRVHRTVASEVLLAPADAAWNKRHIASLRRNIAFLSLRQFARDRGRCPAELTELAREDRWFPAWFPAYAVQVAVGRAVGVYRPR